jgi:hypothetical protein
MLQHASKGLVRSRYSTLVPRTNMVGIVPDIPRRSRSVSYGVVLMLALVSIVFFSGCSGQDARQCSYACTHSGLVMESYTAETGTCKCK